MTRTFISPSKFFMGEGILENMGTYVSNFGDKALLVAHPDDYARVKSALDIAFKDVKCVIGGFGGECTKAEIARLEDIIKKEGVDVVIGLGGGKAIDTAKGVASNAKKPVIIAPTIAATDAPTSALAIIYNEKGEFVEYMFLKSNPNMVVVDTGVIAKAPTRFLVAGIGDALATVFEARACAKSYAKNMSGGLSTKAALAIAETCYATLLEDGMKAKAASEANVVTTAFENIIEANVLLSGLGFESSGLAAAHAVHDGLTVLEEAHHCYHGEKVAFGTLVQLVLENADQSTLDTVLGFCKKVGLPTCLKDLGITNLDDERLMKVAEASCAEGETMVNMPFTVTPKDVAAAIRAADVIGSKF
jgi:glycerol dehydrogenase